jgi:hypothetical protein
VSLPGRCIVCGQSVFWGGRSWRQGSGRGARHHCSEDRERCGAWMPYIRERCARRPGHGNSHRSEYAMENARFMATGRRAA